MTYTTYRIDMMSNDSYNRYMSGSNNYSVESIEVVAENANEAILKAKAIFPAMVIRGNAVSVEDLKAEQLARAEAYKKAEEDKKAKAIAREKAKAEQAGMTVEEYKAEQNRKRKIRKLEREIAELEEELNNKKKYLEKIKKEA